MICPACENQLEQLQIDTLNVDMCKTGCGGVWFDNFELKKVDEPAELTGEKIIDIQKQQKAVEPPKHEKKRHCPRCKDVIMMQHFFSVRREVLIDECAGCGGIWLDWGELEKIRQEFASESDRTHAASKHFSELFDPQLTAAGAKADEARVRRYGKLFNFFRSR